MMFCPADVMVRSTSHGNDRLVLFALCMGADYRGQVSISNRDISALAGVGKTTVGKCIKRLLDIDEVDIVSAGGGRSTPATYAVLMPDAPAPTLINDEDGQIAGEIREKVRAEGPGEVVLQEAPAANVVHSAPHPWWKNRDPSEIHHQPETPAAVVHSVWQPDLPSQYPQSDVGAILYAAGVEIDSNEPFFWMRQEHQRDIPDLLEVFGASSAQELCEMLKRESTQQPRKDVRRLSDIKPRA